MTSLMQKSQLPLEEMRQSLVPDWTGLFSRASFGALDIDKRAEEMIISVDLPGVREEDIDITYEDNRLLLSAKRKQESASSNGYYHAERTWGSWERSLYLPEIDPDSIRATLEEGVLTLVCARLRSEGKHIEIEKRG